MRHETAGQRAERHEAPAQHAVDAVDPAEQVGGDDPLAEADRDHVPHGDGEPLDGQQRRHHDRAGHRLLRVVAVLLGIFNFANQMGQAILVLLATQTLHVSTRGFGLLLAASAVGSVVGGLLNPVLTRRLGLLPSLVLPALVDAAAFVGIGLAPGPIVVAALLAVQGFSVTMWNVVTVSLRQRIVPAHLLGRVNSAYRMLGWGLMPLGALAGGFVAHAAGLRAPYIVAGLLCALSVFAAFPLLLAANRTAPAVR